MKKLRLYLPLFLSLPIVATPAIILTSCSSDSNPFENIEYGQDISCKKDKCSKLLIIAQNHIQQKYYPASNITLTDAQKEINDNQLTVNDFYWEFLIFCANTNKDFSLNAWTYDETNGLTFNASWNGGSIASDNKTTFNFYIDSSLQNNKIQIQFANQSESSPTFSFNSYLYLPLTIVPDPN